MKRLTLLVFSILILVSCSKDEVSSSQVDITGVWEQKGFTETSGLRLVFAPDKSGLRIFRIVYSEDNIVSGLIEYVWELNDSTITIYIDGVDSGVVLTYSLNAEGKLVSEDTDTETPFSKISDSLMGYH